MPTTITLRNVSKNFALDGTAGGDPVAHLLKGLQGSGSDAGQSASHAERDASKVYALDDISLQVRPGEVLAVLGPSGCGKSTLLRVIAGLLGPDAGEVLYDSEPLEAIPRAERGVGMVFQNYALYPHLPGVDNVGMFLKLRRREAEIPDRVREISEAMNIDLRPLLDRKPGRMSGGERQRLAIARCLARDPRVFLFDEPFANLDAKFRTESRVELKRLLRRYAVTSVYVTHDQIEATALADRIAVMRAGQLVQIGTYKTLYETPKHIFVAGFLGTPSMNFFVGEIRAGFWQGGGLSWGPVRPDLADGVTMTLGVRPEHFRVDDAGQIEAVVGHIDRLYPERRQHVYMTVAGRDTVVTLPLEMRIARGDVLRLSIMPEQAHLFDYKTGARVG